MIVRSIETLDEAPRIDTPHRRESCAACGRAYEPRVKAVNRYVATGVSVHLGCERILRCRTATEAA